MKYKFNCEFTSDEDFGNKKPKEILIKLLNNKKALKKFEMTEIHKIITTTDKQEKDPFDFLLDDFTMEV